MDAVELIKSRRSIRKYKDEVVSRELMKEIVEIASYTPSWCNFQIARYTLIDNPEAIEALTKDGVQGFAYNMNTLKTAKGVAVLSYVTGQSGKWEEKYCTKKGDTWEAFDAGLACQSFCLAAKAKGVSTCIFGLIDEENIAKIAKLPENEVVAALIVYGYADEEPATPPRKDVAELCRFV